ncbi:unnamed protein product, partial [Thlaspi arvense]
SATKFSDQSPIFSDIPSRSYDVPTDRGSLVVPSHKVTVHDRQQGVVHEFEFPETLNFGKMLLFWCSITTAMYDLECRDSSCCTSCVVRVKSGELRQPQALGISAELKSHSGSYICDLARNTCGLETRETICDDDIVCGKMGQGLI